MTCAQCNAQLDATDPHTEATYDEQAQSYYCNIDCFRDWADDNFDAVTEFYEKLNVN